MTVPKSEETLQLAGSTHGLAFKLALCDASQLTEGKDVLLFFIC